DRRRQGPEAVGRFPEVRHVEGQHQQADEAVDDDREIPSADVPGDELDNPIRGAPYRRVECPGRRVDRRRGGIAVSAHATPRAAGRVTPSAGTAARRAAVPSARAAFSLTRAISRTATMSASR